LPAIVREDHLATHDDHVVADDVSRVQHDRCELRAEVLLRRWILCGLGSEELAGRPVVASRAEELHRQAKAI
jgi:hypothetical protein